MQQISKPPLIIDCDGKKSCEDINAEVLTPLRTLATEINILSEEIKSSEVRAESAALTSTQAADLSNVFSHTDDYAYVITDKNGRIAFYIDNSGNIHSENIIANEKNLLSNIYDASNKLLGSISTSEIENLVFALTDQNDKVALGIEKDGSLIVSGSTKMQNSDEYAFCITDKENKVALGIKNDGSIVLSPSVNQKENIIDTGKYTAEINHFFCYGQSWSMGFDTGIITTEQKYDNLSFNGGAMTQTNTTDENDMSVYTSFIPLVETLDRGTGTAEFANRNLGETESSGQTDMVKQLILAENGTAYTEQSYQLLASVPGEGSRSLDSLSEGTMYFNRLITQIEKAYEISQSLGKTYKVQAVSWVQGAGSNYQVNLEKLRHDISEQAKIITGQENEVILITWQIFPVKNASAHDLYWRYVETSEKYPHIYCAGASYNLTPVSNGNLHLNALSQVTLGAYFGLVYKRVIVDEKNWEPLKPVKMTKQGKILLIKFNNKTPLVLDIDTFEKQINYGFEVSREGNDIPILEIKLVSSDTMKIRIATDFTVADKVVYGVNGKEDGLIKSNLRDSQGDFIIYDKENLNLPLHNWCVVFDKQITLGE